MSDFVEDGVANVMFKVEQDEMTRETDCLVGVGTQAKSGFGSIELEHPFIQLVFVHQPTCEGFGINQVHAVMIHPLSRACHV